MNASAQGLSPAAKRSEFRTAAYHWHVDCEGDGPSCLLIHGTGASAESWQQLKPHLTKRFRVVSVDLPGHARTQSRRSLPLSLPHMAEALQGLFDQESHLLGETTFGIGHSAGAAILAEMALRRPHYLSRIVSINGALMPLRGMARCTFTPLARITAQSSFVTRQFVRRLRQPDVMERLLRQTGSRLDARSLEHYRRLCQDPAHVTGALRMMAAWQLDHLYPRLPALTCPVHFIAAERDRMILVNDARYLHGLVPQSTLDILDDLGHLAHEEAPEQIAGLVQQYVAGDTRRSSMTHTGGQGHAHFAH